MYRRITRENDLLVHQISQANVERRSAEEQIQKLKSQCDDKDKQLEQLKTQLKFLVVTKSPNSQSVGNVKETTANPLTRLKVESNNRSLSMGENPRDCPILHSLPPKYYCSYSIETYSDLLYTIFVDFPLTSTHKLLLRLLT